VFERILVPLDGSERAERVLPLALHVAGWFDAELTLLHVLSPVRAVQIGGGPGATGRQTPADIQYPDELHDRGLSLGSAYLDEVVDRLNARGVQARTSIVAGVAPDMIVARAVAGGFGLIAMTTTARAPLLRLFRRGTLRGIWPHSPVPLLVLGDDYALAEHTRGLSPEELVVLLDGTRAAEWSLPYAQRVAQAAGLPVTLLRSLHRPPFAPADGSEPGPGEERDAEQYLSERAEDLRKEGIQVETRLSYRDPAHAVAGERQGDPYRIVVMAARMRHGWRRALLGSEADEVIRRSHGAVMVIPVGRPARGARPAEDGEEEGLP